MERREGNFADGRGLVDELSDLDWLLSAIQYVGASLLFR